MRKSNKKKRKLICNVCGAYATHVVLVELREKPGLPLKEDNVLMLVCDEHSKNTSFDHWVPYEAFNYLCAEWKKQGYILAKPFCTINIKPLQV
jgi:hypothetical protein